MRVKISELKIGNRIRTNPGDLTALRDSMRRLGLLQPILIDSKYNLIAGFRRLESAKMLGWESIEARLIETRDKKERLEDWCIW
jgi:ParB family chromosome partitioning protein